jgi:hypothetical protein
MLLSSRIFPQSGALTQQVMGEGLTLRLTGRATQGLAEAYQAGFARSGSIAC